MTGYQDDTVAGSRGFLQHFPALETNPVSKKSQQFREIGKTHEEFLMVMIEDTPEGLVDFPLEFSGSYLAVENPDNGFPDQGSLWPIQQIINPAQTPDVEPGDGERQEPEEQVVQFHLEELAQA
jgi:hypothetical protein